ncbi:unnamed protein product, partial [Polarella glacialis]
YVGQFVLTPGEDGATTLSLPAGADSIPQSVIAVRSGAVVRLSLAEFVGVSLALAELRAESAAQNSETSVHSAAATAVRLYTRRPRGRRAAVARALGAVGMQVEAAALAGLPELLPWWAIFDEAATLQPGLCATRSRATRYRLSPKAEDSVVPPALLDAVLTGGAVVRRGRVVLRGVRLVKALRLGRATSAVAAAASVSASWANLGGFVGQAIAGSLLDDGDAGTAV